MRHQRGDVGGKEILSDAHAENQRACLPDGENRIRRVRADNSQSVGANQPGRSLHDGFPEIAGIVHFNQMDDDLGVRLALETITLPEQFFPKLHVVFDNAVVNDGKFSVVAGMGMGVYVVGRAMRRPAGVADSGSTGNQPPVFRLFPEVLNASRDLADGDSVPLHHRNSGGIIAPVFQL